MMALVVVVVMFFVLEFLGKRDHHFFLRDRFGENQTTTFRQENCRRSLCRVGPHPQTSGDISRCFG